MNITIQRMFYYSHFLKLDSKSSPVQSYKFKDIISLLGYADQTLKYIWKQIIRYSIL